MNERRGTRTDVLARNEALLLRAAGLLEPERAGRAWQAFREQVKEGEETLVERRLLPLVFRNLLRLGHRDEPYLRTAYVQSLSRNAMTLDRAARALRALHGASIKTLVLKGLALLLTHYRDLAVRPMSDVDILVPEARMTDALDVLEASGWRADPARSWLGTELHAGTLVSPDGWIVDLHRHATYEARFAAADDAFFAGSIPLEVSRAPTATMNASHQLLHTVVHGLRWSIVPSSIWVIDTMTLLRGGAVDVEKTVTAAEDLRLTHALGQGLELVRETYGGHDTLDGLLARLQRPGTLRTERIEQWFRVREPAGWFGALPNLWFAYRRSVPGGRAPLSGFPAFLSRVWHIDKTQSLSRLMVAKVARRLRRRAN